ncbi:MAG: hypothetical protein DWQ40_10010 [Actinobacteria bacterium]|nr:MAG: hypothetical protein DWQ40_10010 [Actinomycetota bacterium]
MIRKRNLALFALMSMLLVACSGGDIAEQIIESQDGVGDVEIDENNGSVSIDVEGDDGEGGSITIGGGDLPDDFPFDLPGGGEVMSVFASNDGEATVTIQYPAGEFEALKSSFESQIQDGGYEIINVGEQPGAASTWNMTMGEGSALVSINAGEDATIVGVIYEGLG